MDEVDVKYLAPPRTIRDKNTQEDEDNGGKEEEEEEEEEGPLILASLCVPNNTKEAVSIWSEAYGNGVWENKSNLTGGATTTTTSSSSSAQTSTASSLLQLRAPPPKVVEHDDADMVAINSKNTGTHGGLTSREDLSQRMTQLAGYKPSSISSSSSSSESVVGSSDVARIEGFTTPPHASLTISSRYVAGELRYFVGKVLGIRPRHPRFTDNFFESVIVCEAEVIDQETLDQDEKEKEEEKAIHDDDDDKADQVVSPSAPKPAVDSNSRNSDKKYTVSDVSSAGQSGNIVKITHKRGSSLQQVKSTAAVTEEAPVATLSSVSSSDSTRPQRRRSSTTAAVAVVALVAAAQERLPVTSSSSPAVDRSETGGRPKREVKQRTLFDPELEVERSRRPLTTSSSSSSSGAFGNKGGKKKSKKSSSLASKTELEELYLRGVSSLKKFRGTCGAGLSDLSINASIEKLKNVTLQDYLEGNQDFNFECLCPWEIETDGVINSSATSPAVAAAIVKPALTLSTATPLTTKDTAVVKSRGKGSKRDSTSPTAPSTASKTMTESPPLPPPPPRPSVSSFDHPWLSLALSTRFDTLEQLSLNKAQSLIKAIRSVATTMEAKEFVNPVDLSQYPDYGAIVPVPMDLTRILWRTLCGYYRRVSSVQADVDLLLSNAILYNSEESLIVKNARVIHDQLMNILTLNED